ncbi:hypothetical protein QTN25_005170 [Entamoeba marina]
MPPKRQPGSNKPIVAGHTFIASNDTNVSSNTSNSNPPITKRITRGDTRDKSTNKPRDTKNTSSHKPSSKHTSTPQPSSKHTSSNTKTDKKQPLAINATAATIKQAYVYGKIVKVTTTSHSPQKPRLDSFSIFCVGVSRDLTSKIKAEEFNSLTSVIVYGGGKVKSEVLEKSGQMNIPIVNPQWLEDSIETGRAEGFTGYEMPFSEIDVDDQTKHSTEQTDAPNAKKAILLALLQKK